MPRPLVLHPASRSGADIAIEADACRPHADRLDLTYVVSGQVGALFAPPPDAQLRTDGLWKRTCFEAFLQPAPGEAYIEFNLAPSGRWATYRFDRYREGMRDAADVTPGPIAVLAGPDRLELTVSVTLPASEAAARLWRLGLTAVIEELDGRVSYWALAHPSPQPDFHDAASFVAALSQGVS